MTKFIEVLVAILTGVGLIYAGHVWNDSSTHDAGVLALGYAVAALKGSLGNASN